jgi:hypothetical protein
METDKNTTVREAAPAETEPNETAVQQTDSDDTNNEKLSRKERNQKKDKEGAHKTLIRVIISIMVIVVGVFLILFFVAKAAKYDSIGAMLENMSTELSLMWQRISN